MTKEKLTKEEIAMIVEQEGLGYAIQYYLNPEEIGDKDLQILWKHVKRFMDQIEKMLEIE